MLCNKSDGVRYNTTAFHYLCLNRYLYFNKPFVHCTFLNQTTVVKCTRDKVNTSWRAKIK